VKLKPKHILWCFLFWAGISLLSFSGTYFTTVLKDLSFYWSEAIPFATVWLTWFPFTFPVIYLANKFSYADTPALKFTFYHLGFFVVINTLQVLVSAQYLAFMLHSFNEGYYSNILSKTAISGSFYNLIVYAAILIIVNSIKYYNDLQEEKSKIIELEKQLVNSRMSFLKQQLQPHFLFNTHHSIITLMKLDEKKKAINMMEKLSDLMRFALKENSTQEITLEKELSLLNLYLDIQKIRFEEKLNVKLEVAEDLLQAFVPSMILQPIVENSIKYAVEKSSSESTISVSAAKENNILIICIEDKVKEHKDEPVLQKGIGLSNTEERLEKLYGKQQQIKFKHLSRDGYNGFQVTIKIPLRYAGM
jgi:two-component system, LytTR family, sensor kinase